QRLSQLTLSSAAERHQVLIEWNASSAAERQDVIRQDGLRQDGLVLDLFAGWVHRTPEAPALQFDEPSAGTAAELSYAELDRRAAQVADHLRGRGVGREAIVAVAMERAPELAVSLLGLLKTGAAFLPLHAEDPVDRLASIVDDAGAALLLTQERLLERLTPLGCERLAVDTLDLDDPASPQVHAQATAEQAAYVIYTSGSTGKPKGIVVSHGALSRLLRYRAASTTSADAKLHKTALSFDVAVAEILLPLICGGRTVLARPGGETDGPYLTSLIQQHEVTLAVFPPALLASLLDQGSLADCPSLRLVGVGGEAVPAELPERFAAVSRAELWNRYGPTETTIFSTEGRAESGEGARFLPIGRPAAGCSAVLFDRHLRPVPMGVTGEIGLAGPTLARGYLGRPAATAAAFVPDPLATQAGADPGSRLYRTGDLARTHPDGTLEFLGRRDEQVKIRGFRVELGEVEAALAAHPGLAEAAVIDRRDNTTGSRLLVAFTVADQANDLNQAALRKWLGQRLPGHMVPAAWVDLGALPRLASGKIDRRALRRRPLPKDAGEIRDEALRNANEELVAGIFAQLLGRRQVAADDDFFHLGGHSLLATQAVSRIRETFGVELPLRQLFEASTVRALTQRIAEAAADDRLVAPPITASESSGQERPVSFSQERLWFLDQLDPGASAYNLSLPVRLEGPLDSARLQHGLDALTQRHETLRSRCETRNGRPRLMVEARSPALARIELGRLSEVDRQGEADRLRTSEAARPFDLAR
ncbi:MAG: amino acid adenylation domain-containing protein, partial [Acidobacteriota bacterium]